MPQNARQQFNYTPVDNEMLRSRALEQERLKDETNEDEYNENNEEQFDDLNEDDNEEEQFDDLNEDEEPMPPKSECETAKKYMKTLIDDWHDKYSKITKWDNINSSIIGVGNGLNTIPALGTILGLPPLLFGAMIQYIIELKYTKLYNEGDELEKKLKTLSKKYKIKKLMFDKPPFLKKMVLRMIFSGKRMVFSCVGTIFGIGLVILLLFGVFAIVCDTIPGCKAVFF